MKPKIIAMYLPQFHRINENDEFWGKGFTDWVTVRNAKPLFKGHQQPRVPLNNNYYDLSKVENVEWQAKLAHDHGIYGFGVYHYWFNNEKNILTRPAEILKDSVNGYVKYFFCWDNASWKRSWSNVDGNDWAPLADNAVGKQKGEKILIPYILGREPDWENHYKYCRSHFLSPNYEKIDNKPIFCLISYTDDIKEMCDYWDELAKQDGFDGMFFVLQHAAHKIFPKRFFLYDYEPHYVGWGNISFIRRVCNKIQRMLGINLNNGMTKYDYDKIWRKLLDYTLKQNDSRIIPGAFVNYDDTPRRGEKRSKVMVGSNPGKFKIYFKKFMDIVSKQGKEYVFFTAWNEWGEGAYLEPDMINGYKYLDAIKDIMEDFK